MEEGVAADTQPSKFSPLYAAEALAANLFLQPTVMRTLIRYILTTHTPLDELADGRRMNRQEELAADTEALAKALLQRPSAFEMTMQYGVLAQTPNAKPRMQNNFHWGRRELAIPDTLIIEAKFQQLAVLIASLAHDSDDFFANVVHGGMLGHYVCSNFRFVSELVKCYSPPYAIALMVEAQMDSIVANIHPEQFRVHGEFLVRAIGKGLSNAIRKEGDHLTATEAGTLNKLANLMLETKGDAQPFLTKLKTLVDNLQKIMRLAYNNKARGQPVFS